MMSRNKKNILKFSVATLATAAFTYCISREPMNGYHIAGIIVSIIVFLWFCWHVFTDE